MGVGGGSRTRSADAGTFRLRPEWVSWFLLPAVFFCIEPVLFYDQKNTSTGMVFVASQRKGVGTLSGRFCSTRSWLC